MCIESHKPTVFFLSAHISRTHAHSWKIRLACDTIVHIHFSGCA